MYSQPQFNKIRKRIATTQNPREKVALRVLLAYLNAHDNDLLIRLFLMEGAAAVPQGTWTRKATSRGAVVRLLQQVQENLTAAGHTPNPGLFSPKDTKIFTAGVEFAKKAFLGVWRTINNKPQDRGSESSTVYFSMSDALDMAYDSAQELMGFSGERKNSMYLYGVKHRSKVLSGQITVEMARFAWSGFMHRHAIREAEKLQAQYKRQKQIDENAVMDPSGGYSHINPEGYLPGRDLSDSKRNTVVNLMEQVMSAFEDKANVTGRDMRFILMQFLNERSGLNQTHQEVIGNFLQLWLDDPDSIKLRGGGAGKTHKTLVEQIWERMGKPQPEDTKKDTIRKILDRKLEPFLRKLKMDPAFKEKLDELEFATMLHKGPYTLSRLGTVREMLESVNPEMLFSADIRLVDDHHVRLGTIKAPKEQFSVILNGKSVGSILAAKQGPEGWVLVASKGKPQFAFGDTKIFRKRKP